MSMQPPAPLHTFLEEAVGGKFGAWGRMARWQNQMFPPAS